MAIEPGTYIDPMALVKLPEPCYRSLMASLLSDLDPTPKMVKRSWTDAFSLFSLLAQSILGGFCSRELQLQLHKLAWQDVEHVLEIPLDEPVWLGVHKERITYPIYIAAPVRYALLLLIQTAMAQHPTRNAALRMLRPEQRLAPPRESLTRRQQSYLANCARNAELGFIPTLKNFRATGRWLMTRIYPLDILHAQLGLVPATAPLISQLRETGPLSILAKLRPHNPGLK